MATPLCESCRERPGTVRLDAVRDDDGSLIDRDVRICRDCHARDFPSLESGEGQDRGSSGRAAAEEPVHAAGDVPLYRDVVLVSAPTDVLKTWLALRTIDVESRAFIGDDVEWRLEPLDGARMVLSDYGPIWMHGTWRGRWRAGQRPGPAAGWWAKAIMFIIARLDANRTEVRMETDWPALAGYINELAADMRERWPAVSSELPARMAAAEQSGQQSDGSRAAPHEAGGFLDRVVDPDVPAVSSPVRPVDEGAVGAVEARGAEGHGRESALLSATSARSKLQVPHQRDAEIMRRWRAGETTPKIAADLSAKEKTIRNCIVRLRRTHGADVVPYRAPRGERPHSKE